MDSFAYRGQIRLLIAPNVALTNPHILEFTIKKRSQNSSSQGNNSLSDQKRNGLMAVRSEVKVSRKLYLSFGSNELSAFS